MTDKPKGDGDRRGPGDTELARAAAAPRKYATLGARLVFGEELPGEHLAWCTEDAVSTSTVSATNCELACRESCERVSSLTPVGEDMVQFPV